MRDAINSVNAQRSLVVDGTDQHGNFAGDGENAPFVVFDVERQENIAGPFGTRQDGEKARSAILAGAPPMLDSGALLAYQSHDRKRPEVTVRDAAQALLKAFGGDTPSWLREEAVALENALACEAGANEGELPAAREGRKPEIASTEANWKEVAGSLYGAVDSLETQVNQMKGLFPDEDGMIQEALEEAGEATRSYLAASRASHNSAIGDRKLPEKPVTSRMLAEQYPVKGSMPHSVVHQLYQLRKAEISTLSQRAVILEFDLRELDRGGRAVVASMLYAKCDDVARNALLHDEHPHVRSCAVISRSELEPEPGHKPSIPSIDV